jgi:hypothetical protein
MIKFLKLFAVLSWFYSVCLFSLCENCGKNDEQINYQKCGACLQASYCSKECQVSHWKSHKSHCRAEKKQLELPYSKEIYEEIKSARELFHNGHKDDAEQILNSLYEKEQNNRIRADCVYNLVYFDLGQSLNGKINSDGLDIDRLQFAVKFGNKSAAALLFLLNYPDPEVEEDEAFNRYVKAGLEKYMDDPDWGTMIKVRLAYEFYIDSDKDLSSSIFTKLIHEDNAVLMAMGFIGSLKHTLKYYKNKSMINLAIHGAKECYQINSNKSLIPSFFRFEFARMLHEHDPEAKALVQEILADLIQEEYRPAIYFCEEQQIKIAKKKPKKKKKAKVKNNRPNEPEVAEVKASAPLAEVEMPQPARSLSEVKVKNLKPTKASSTAVLLEQTAMEEDLFIAELKQHVALMPIAIKDIKNLIKRQGPNLKLTPQRIIDIAQRIYTSKGGCNTDVAAKIRGTNYWRSKLGRGYRMDWHYIKEGGDRKIEIRHVGRKDGFTYRP